MTDPRLHAVVQMAIARIHAASRTASQRCVEAMDRMLLSGMRSDTERFVWQLAVQDLRRNLAAFNLNFGNSLRDVISAELKAQPAETTQRFEDTDWRSLSLVGESEADQRVSVDRLTRELSIDCEWELRELDAFVLALQQTAASERKRNPLRPEVVATALAKAGEAICNDKPARQVMVRELSRALAGSMRATYAGITEELRQRGIEPISLTVRTVEGPGNDITRDTVPDSGYHTPSQNARREVRHNSHAAHTLSHMFGVPLPPEFSAPTQPSDPDATQPSTGPGGPVLGGYASDTQMLDVIRRIVQIAGLSTDIGAWSASGTAAGPTTGSVSGAGGSVSGTPSSYTRTVPDALSVAQRASLPGVLDAAAANLIRLHRDELQRASTGTLDHMVIDIVAALFDQILADPKIPPQMARQLARLQLPVLRVALKDSTFFSSRRHPVRRLVNRIATLSVAFEDFQTGPGHDFLERVRRLVQEIIEGDFDQVGLYELKLQELEALVAEQTSSQAAPNARVAALLDGKETLLRVQQRYTLALKEQLAHVVGQEFARDFLSQVWSQVVVFTTMRDGADATLTQRMKLAGRDLVLTLQPKSTPRERKEFLLLLPRLMKDLNEGLDLIRWAPKAKKDFFAKLLPAHSQSLKAPPLSDFAVRQLRHQLDLVDKVAIPKPSDVPPDTVPAALTEPEMPISFTAEEARQVGLVDETAIDGEGNMDLDLGEDITTDVDTEPMSLGESADVGTDTTPDAGPAAPPDRGEQLIHHMQPGCAYLMHIDKRGWRKVRLTWVSPGRGFFVFSHGVKIVKTISLTARMLASMLRNNRFRAFEQAELIERATARARRQLASLSGGAAKAGAAKNQATGAARH